MFPLAHLIHEKEGAITDEIIDDVMGSWRRDPNDHIVMYDPTLIRIKRYLQTDMKTQLHAYINHLSGTTHFFSPFLSSIGNNVGNIVMHRRTFQDQESQQEFAKTVDIKQQDAKLHVLNVVWFLHDYDGILWFGDHPVRPKKGKMIMYPLSWCVPVQESCDKNVDIVTLRSTIFIRY